MTTLEILDTSFLDEWIEDEAARLSSASIGR